MAVALRALDAQVETEATDGTTRCIPLSAFRRVPEDTPERETVLAPGG